MKDRIPALNFIRAIAALGVIVFHYICRFDHLFQAYGMFEKISWGDLLVTVFLILSGMLLYRNDRYELYKDHVSRDICLRRYYMKRWKAIYPAFYIAYLAAYIFVNMSELMPDRHADPMSMILTALGIDGYFLEYSPNFYLVGEWFLGAIILLYLLFPVLDRMLYRRPWATVLVLAVLYECSLFYSPFQTIHFRALPSCMISFFAGMLLEKYRLLERKRWMLPAAVLLLPICASISDQSDQVLLNVVTHVGGACIFVCLFYLGKVVMKVPVIGYMFDEVGKLSYPIFLLQHLVIRYVVAVHAPEGVPDHGVTLFLTIALCVLSARILQFITDLLVGGITSLVQANAKRRA